MNKTELIHWALCLGHNTNSAEEFNQCLIDANPTYAAAFRELTLLDILSSVPIGKIFEWYKQLKDVKSPLVS